MSKTQWTIDNLREHLQDAIQLEYWTIPYYMSAMYSIKDPTSDAYRLIQSVVYQEMLHVQLACNVANAYGTEIDLEHCFIVPPYEEQKVPHLKFKTEEDPNDPTQSFCPYSAEIGPLDDLRINAMCLIEYPKWEVHDRPRLCPNVTEYSSIGQFYQAVLFGASRFVDEIRGNHQQVDIFKNFYRNFPDQTVTHSGPMGFQDVTHLVHAITDQGEGERRFDAIPLEFQNTAHGFNSEEDHFDKFIAIKNLTVRPDTYDGHVDPPAGSEGERSQEILLKNFNGFREDMVTLFNGRELKDFGPRMAALGGNILNCWKNGAIPRFS